MKRNIEITALVVGVVMSLSSAIGTFYIQPYRVSKLEEAQRAYEADKRADHELLVRIEERLIAVQEKITVLNEQHH